MNGTGTGGRRVVVVEDNEILQELLCKVIADLGRDPVCAATAEAALDACAGNDPELLISDLNLPGMRGDDLYRRLAEQGRQIPFVLVTGELFQRATREFLEETGVPVIRKPFGLAEVRDRLRAILDGTGE